MLFLEMLVRIEVTTALYVLCYIRTWCNWCNAMYNNEHKYAVMLAKLMYNGSKKQTMFVELQFLLSQKF